MHPPTWMSNEKSAYRHQSSADRTGSASFTDSAPKRSRKLVLLQSSNAPPPEPTPNPGRVPHPFRSLIAKWVGQHKSKHQPTPHIIRAQHEPEGSRACMPQNQPTELFPTRSLDGPERFHANQQRIQTGSLHPTSSVKGHGFSRAAEPTLEQLRGASTAPSVLAQQANDYIER